MNIKFDDVVVHSSLCRCASRLIPAAFFLFASRRVPDCVCERMRLVFCSCVHTYDAHALTVIFFFLHSPRTGISWSGAWRVLARGSESPRIALCNANSEYEREGFVWFWKICCFIHFFLSIAENSFTRRGWRKLDNYVCKKNLNSESFVDFCWCLCNSIIFPLLWISH